MPGRVAGARTLLEQTFHFFSRPNTGVVPKAALEEKRAAWFGKDLRVDPASWQHVLSEEERQDAVAAVVHAEASLATRGAALSNLQIEEFPLPALSQAISRWRLELGGVHGRGFVVIKGIPVDSWTEHQAEVFFWGLGLHLGIPGAQNNEGDLVTHVKDVGADPRTERLYKTNAKIELHCDSADVVGLLCLQTSNTGGTSELVSSVSVYNTLAAEQPELARKLFEREFTLDTRGSGGVNYITLPAAAYDSYSGELRTFWHTQYFRSWTQYPEAPPMAEAHRVVLDAWNEIAARPDFVLPMQLERGDVQLNNNHVIVHGRSAYKDAGGKPRHLLRLWLSLDPPLSICSRASKLHSRAQLTASFILGKLRRSLYAQSEAMSCRGKPQPQKEFV